MKKLVALALALIATAAIATELPYVFGTIKNQAGGEIVLTTSDCPTKNGGDFFVFTRSPEGKIGLTGCWSNIDKHIYVFWSDGDTYTYPIAAIEVSEEFRNRSANNDKVRS
jgi:hypothetical protein